VRFRRSLFSPSQFQSFFVSGNKYDSGAHFSPRVNSSHSSFPGLSTTQASLFSPSQFQSSFVSGNITNAYSCDPHAPIFSPSLFQSFFVSGNTVRLRFRGSLFLPSLFQSFSVLSGNPNTNTP